MNILFIAQLSEQLDCAETVHLTGISEGFEKIGYRSIFLLPSDVQFSKKADIVIPTFRTRGHLRKIIFQLLGFLSILYHLRLLSRIDFIYVRHSGIMFFPYFISILLNKSLIAEFNTLFSKSNELGFGRISLLFARICEYIALSISQKVVCISSLLESELVKNFGKKYRRKILVVNNGVNTSAMRPLNQYKCRSELGLPDESFIVGFIGHLFLWQGIEALLKSAKTLRNRIPNLLILIIGNGRNLLKYKKLSSVLGVDSLVKFLGSVNNQKVLKWISSFDVCVAPGTSEKYFDYRIRSPLKINEYLACGKPVIAGHLEATAELFQRSKVGYQIRPGDAKQLADRIFYLHFHPVIRKQMGTRAREYAEKHLDWERVAKKILTRAISK